MPKKFFVMKNGKKEYLKVVSKGTLSKKNKKPNTLANKVKAIINKTTESKYCTESLVNGTYFNSVITDPGDWYRCLPQLPQSTEATSYTREGKKVEHCTVRVHWNFKYGPTDAQTRDIFVVLYVVQPKFQKASRRTDVNNQVSFYNSAYLDNGQGTNTNFAGTWQTSGMPVQKDLFTLLHKKIFRLSKASGRSNGTGVVGQYDGYGSGMYAIGIKDNISHTWSHKLPNLLYTDGQYNSVTNADVQAVLPSNTSPVWAVGYYYADGTAADTAGGILQVNCWTELFFKDS
jgi:hypothetical protein